MIKPGEIPQYTGNLELLEKAHANLKTDAGHIRDTGADVHSHFQGLSAYYKAPEAERLFATTKPVKDRADTFADDLGKVSSALSEYATEIRPLVTKLTQLKTDATQFVNDNKDDDDWEYDEDKVDEHNQLRDDITSTVAAFWAAERTCHNKITALFGGTQMVAGDGSKAKNQYGFNADDLKNAKLPWGDPVEEKHHVWEVGHWVKSFVWDGLIVDGVWGTIKGLGTLVGCGGWDAMGQAWKGLAQLGTGLAISAVPGAREAFWGLPDDKLPSWLRDSRTAMKETGKALVAWDEWGKNPGRAAGAVTFNVVTTVFTGGAGGAAAGAGKAGAVAKALSVAGKAGRVIDPMTYVAKGAGAGLSKIGDITKGLKGIGKVDVPHLPDGAVELPNGSLLEPNGNLVPPPPGSVDVAPAAHGTGHGASGLPESWQIQQPGAPFPAGAHAPGGSFDHVPGGHTNPGGHVPTGGPAHAAGSYGPAPTSLDNAAGGTAGHVPGGGHGSSTPWYHQTPSNHVPGAPAGHVPGEVGSHVPGQAGPPHVPAHDVPGTGHPHTADAPHGPGHDAPGAHGHDGAHGGHADDAVGHGDDATHAGDHVGDAAGAAAHHGTDTPVAPGHAGTDVPGSGAAEPFEYKPHMSAADFNNLATDAEKHAAAAAELERGTNPWPSSSDRAGQAYGDAYWNDYIDHLGQRDPAGSRALTTYSGHSYNQINKPLRDKVDLPSATQKVVDNMDRVMGTRPVPEDIMVVRGTAVDHLNLRSPLAMQGKIYDDLGYTSTSLGKTPAFAHKPVHMHLRVPKDTPALWIDRISDNPGERELLLARGTEYKVTRVFKDAAGTWQVYGEVLPRPKP
ncbi:ADP-ribosyltransferase [Streptomyces sp. RTd22]|uniref:ADP-ribosyltransferase n=1 Tax=Streptomyces sp. RTd22 TaxID=1841249 RepID=UPI0007C5D2E0|nr:ADP-ribosyltransferase [Streptomyces sp. RTd22]